MNNPVRAALQRSFEVRRFLGMAGPMRGGRALEIGCGRGVGLQLILDRLGADSVDGFDLDPRMVGLARERLGHSASRVRLWIGDATAIPVPAASYDAVFDFGIIHHIPRWRLALREVERVLKPNGRFYAEEALSSLVCHPIVRRLLDHPQADRFDASGFEAAVRDAGLSPLASRRLGRLMVWVAARKPTALFEGLHRSSTRTTR